MATNKYNTQNPFLNSFMPNNDWQSQHASAPNTAAIPLNNTASMKTNNGVMGNSSSDPRYDPANKAISNIVKPAPAPVMPQIEEMSPQMEVGKSLASPEAESFYGSLPSGEMSNYEQSKMRSQVRPFQGDSVTSAAQAQKDYAERQIRSRGSSQLQKDRSRLKANQDKMIKGATGSYESSNLEFRKTVEPQSGFQSNYTAPGLDDFDMANEIESVMSTPPTLNVGQEIGSSFGDKFSGAMDKVGEVAGKAGDMFGKVAPFAPLVGEIFFNQGAMSSAIDDLQSVKEEMQGAVGNLANARYNELEFLGDQLSEDRRKVGEMEKGRISGDLEKVAATRTGGLVSGSIKETSEDIIDSAQTRTDMRLSDLENKKLEMEAKVIESNASDRSSLNAKIDEVNAQIAELEKEKTMGPIKAIAETGSNLLMASNPALAIGLKVGTSLMG